MTIPLREYLAQRRRDIQAEMRGLKLELTEIDAAEHALDGVTEPVRRPRGRPATGRKTLKELALEVLSRHYPNGVEAQSILAEILLIHGVEVARESMSPQLSRLGADGIITKVEGNLWRLSRAPLDPALSDETPGEPTPGASTEAVNDLWMTRPTPATTET